MVKAIYISSQTSLRASTLNSELGERRRTQKVKDERYEYCPDDRLRAEGCLLTDPRVIHVLILV